VRILKITALPFLILCLTSGAFAESREYSSVLPPGKLIPAVIDELGRAGFRFTVRTVFNEARDGKQGFVFVLQPRQTLCELSFFSDRTGSQVRIFTQDAQDLARFHLFFVQNMHMTEAVSTLPERPPAGWPVPR